MATPRICRRSVTRSRRKSKQPEESSSLWEVMILITGAHKAFALYKAIEEGVNHMWTVSAFQQHPNTVFVCDEDATLELKVKTVKYFKGLMLVHNKLVEPLYSMKERGAERSHSKKPYSD
uniref:Glucosamine-6-phosphate deaminase 1 n=1 Tax=Strigops habroptila TaxID=2489341 RepID=A0A672UWD0_STRHB